MHRFQSLKKQQTYEYQAKTQVQNHDIYFANGHWPFVKTGRTSILDGKENLSQSRVECQFYQVKTHNDSQEHER